MQNLYDSIRVSMYLAFIVQVALPPYFIYRVWRAGSRIGLLSSLLLGAPFLAFMYVVLPWSISSVYLRHLFPFLFALLVLVRLMKWGSLSWLPSLEGMRNRISFWGGVFFDGVLALIAVYFLVEGIRGLRVPEGLELGSPVRYGFVFHGGASSMLNYHFPNRAQRYAMDIQGLHRWGGRAKGVYPSNLHHYAIFGDTVYSPCDCRVVRVVDGLEDNPPGVMDTVNLAGNHVILLLERDGEAFMVILAHLMKGSIRVVEGDYVRSGTPIGLVGNSGNTTEPHLHIHAVRGSDPDSILLSEWIPIFIDGRFPVRNDLIGR